MLCVGKTVSDHQRIASLHNEMVLKDKAPTPSISTKQRTRSAAWCCTFTEHQYSAWEMGAQAAVSEANQGVVNFSFTASAFSPVIKQLSYDPRSVTTVLFPFLSLVWILDLSSHCYE
ncbi:hypothetical protein Tco_0003263 [Tanacetum coccineum]